jgi:hypothetical protein
MGNDPRPHYFHQTNLADSAAPDGAVFYPVLDAMLAEYKQYFNANAPIVQLTESQIGDQIARQDTWASANASSVAGYVEGARVTLVNNGTAALDIPLTGTEAGATYGGSRSGWVRTARGSAIHTAATAWPAAPTSPPPPAAVQLPLLAAASVAHADAAASAPPPPAMP